MKKWRNFAYENRLPMNRIGTLFFLLMLIAMTGTGRAQEADTLALEPETTVDSLAWLRAEYQHRLDSLTVVLHQTLADKDASEEKVATQGREIADLEGRIRLLQEAIEKMEQKERFTLEKEDLYKEAKAKEIQYLKNTIKEKEEALRNEKESCSKLSLERERYLNRSDSLQQRLMEAEKQIIQTNEALKYTQQRAKEAEAKVNAATAKKKKVCAIQGIAMKAFRTPNWSLAPDKTEDGSVVYKIINKNGGSVEFDYTAGASVMLWDLTQKEKPKETDSISTKFLEIKKFDQDFSYSLGLYVGFGGSNLFKNFYVGPSFKFLDFFHFTAGVNICEYEMLTGALQEGDILPAGFSLTDQISKVWKPKPFVSLSFDLDFISYIKK